MKNRSKNAYAIAFCGQSRGGHNPLLGGLREGSLFHSVSLFLWDYSSAVIASILSATIAFELSVVSPYVAELVQLRPLSLLSVK